MPFRGLDIDITYSGRGELILSRFVLPVLMESVEYDRVTSFFSIRSLVAIAEGLDELWKRRGRMRLILGVHSVPSDLAEAARKSEDPSSEVVALIRQRVVDGVANIRDEMQADLLSTIAWMMKDGMLSVKVAIPVALDTEPPGLFHNKQLIFKDEAGDVIAAVGSPNETGSALGSNIEHLKVFTSWEQYRYAESEIHYFQCLWKNEREDVFVKVLDSSFADQILSAIPSEFRKGPPAFFADRHFLNDVVEVAAKMPALALVSGGHTALFPHQELAFLDALSRWPIRTMLADEVGLGKTFETGAVMRYMVDHFGVQRILILAPKAVLFQWQAELYEHFGLDAWVYDSARRAFVSSRDDVRFLQPSEPVIGRSTPRIAIVSAQLARGTRTGGHIFRNDPEMPELLIVDEAHSARVKPDLSGEERPTLMWRMLNDIVRKVPHVLFATATPMQMHWREYHALLELLGLPKNWAEPKNYHESLQLIVSDSNPDLADASLLAKLIRSSLMEYQPASVSLNEQEKVLATQLVADDWDLVSASFIVQNDWDTARHLLLKVHPARFLTIRNTRSALEQIGYSFPRRNLPGTSLVVSDRIKSFYLNVETYLSEAYFDVERALYKGRQFPIGFVKSAYQQRLASSLDACRLSLVRRRERILSVEASSLPSRVAQSGFEELSDSDIFESDEELPLEPVIGEIDTETLQSVAEAASLERSYLDGLIDSLEQILSTEPDPKILETLRLVRMHLAKGDKVLVFSRYTDTLDAVIKVFQNLDQRDTAPYAVYTGQRAAIDAGFGQKRSTRKGIREALDSGAVRVVFCSDAASEGLNLQAARVLINVDVPWNPARLEQRIGRIARLGQKAETVDVYNLWYPESVEARMYTRLMERGDLFELAVGEFPDVIGRAIRDELSARFGHDRNDADPIAELNRLKNDIQVQALRRLWDRTVPTRTLTGKFREELAAIALSGATRFGIQISDDGEEIRFEIDGVIYKMSRKPGGDDVISLTHPALKRLLCLPVSYPAPIEIMENDDGPVFFSQDKIPLDPVTFPGLLAELMADFVNVEVSKPQKLNMAENGSLKNVWEPEPSALVIPIDLECDLSDCPSESLDALIYTYLRAAPQ
jgi:superfamily II DNA or RNA helicase